MMHLRARRIVEMSVTVVSFGAHYRWTLPEVLREQLRLAHDLREDLASPRINS